KILRLLLPRLAKKHRLRLLAGDCGYDDSRLRLALRKLGIRPLLKHREFNNLQRAWNRRITKKDYNQRWKNETTFSAIKRKYGSYLTSRKWFNQLKEMKLLAIIHNLDVDLRKFFILLVGFLQSKNK
ncbi:MAG: hypothetical protein QMD14_03555, partial [Candidatus Aenigmarchaeota archaeon]|nr:hypothetical protein [Candidatus Aenigmarchaeota archaeon]